jgi:hypothetical protein
MNITNADLIVIRIDVRNIKKHIIDDEKEKALKDIEKLEDDLTNRIGG